MKKIIFVLIIAFMAINSFSQNIIPDVRLLERFKQVDIDFFLQNNPNHVDYMNFMLDNSYQIIDMPTEKLNDLPDLFEYDKELQTVSNRKADNFDFQNVNIYKYEFQIHPAIQSTYKIGNTGKAIIFFSGLKIAEMYNESKTK